MGILEGIFPDLNRNPNSNIFKNAQRLTEINQTCRNSDKISECQVKGQIPQRKKHVTDKRVRIRLTRWGCGSSSRVPA
jgi:hypothetical protein